MKEYKKKKLQPKNNTLKFKNQEVIKKDGSARDRRVTKRKLS